MSYTAQELNGKVTFEEYQLLLDSNGEPIRGSQGETFSEWVEIGEAFAKVEPLVGREFLAAAAIQSEGLVKFTLRYRAGLHTAMRLGYDGWHWNMTSIQNIKSRNRELLIYAKRIE